MKKIDDKIAAKVNTWLNDSYDEFTKNEVRKLIEQNDTDEITDAFYKDLEFGTGGLRGIMGVGTNRVNKYTLGAATQGLSNYLKIVYPNQQIKVVIAYDNRNNAEFFARVTADVFSANGVFVYIFESLRPTPELSFAIRLLGCHSGIMLTASHNPKEYSGYKAYWKDGCQVVAPHDKNIISEVLRIDSVNQINFNSEPENIKLIGKEIDKSFLETIQAVSINPQACRLQHNLNIVFSPIHGTGVYLIPKALAIMGFTNINLVEEQCTPDGNFPTVIYPNPEEKDALKMALELAEKLDSELVMATDPDGDRVGVAVRDNNKKLVLLNGNQTGVLIFYYLLEQWKEKKLLTNNEFIVKTIVTTNLIDKIAEAYGVKCYNVLTGFKYIGELMTNLEGKETFIAGAEESYGYLIGNHVRDKDAVVACTTIAEMAAHYKNLGKSLYQILLDIYKQYGFYKEDLISITKKGKHGAEEISEIMTRYRQHCPKAIGGKKVVNVKDYLGSIDTNLITGEKSKIDLPKSNVLQFITEGGYIVSLRPSGTEPKIKYYVSVNVEFTGNAPFSDKEKEVSQLISKIIKELA